CFGRVSSERAAIVGARARRAKWQRARQKGESERWPNGGSGILNIEEALAPALFKRKSFARSQASPVASTSRADAAPTAFFPDGPTSSSFRSFGRERPWLEHAPPSESKST